jgi:hypothetical protein
MTKLYVWRAGFAGDIIFSTSAIRQIKEQGRFGEIVYGSWSAYADCIAGNPHISSYVRSDSFRPESEGWVSWEVSHENYRKAHADAMQLYWGEQLLNQAFEYGLLDHVGPDSRPDLYLFGSKPTVPSRLALLSIYSTNGVGQRLWDVDGNKAGDKWVAVVDFLKAKGYTVAQTGLIREPAISNVDYDLRGKSRRLMDYFQLVAQAELLVTIDSLPLHLGACRIFDEEGKMVRDGIPTVAICGPTGRPGVISDDAGWIVEVCALPDRPKCRCWESTPYGGFKCPYGNECMKRITVEDVCDGISRTEIAG